VIGGQHVAGARIGGGEVLDGGECRGVHRTLHPPPFQRDRADIDRSRSRREQEGEGGRDQHRGRCASVAPQRAVHVALPRMTQSRVIVGGGSGMRFEKPKIGSQVAL
jgi:hypothetical protein